MQKDKTHVTNIRFITWHITDGVWQVHLSNLTVYPKQSNKMSYNELHITWSTQRGRFMNIRWLCGQPNLSHHYLIMADGGTRPPWKYHWFHFSQLVSLGVIPLPLPTGKNTLMEPGCSPTATNIYKVWHPTQFRESMIDCAQQ